MTDTSTEAVEAFIQGPLKEAVLSEGMPTTPEDTQDVYAAVRLLRALAAERDALRAALEAVACEYDPSECSANGQTMYDMAHAALKEIARAV